MYNNNNKKKRSNDRLKPLHVSSSSAGIRRSRTPVGLYSDNSSSNPNNSSTFTYKSNRNRKPLTPTSSRMGNKKLYRHNKSENIRSGRLPNISNSPTNSSHKKKYSKSHTKLPQVRRVGSPSSSSSPFDVEKQNRVNKVMERFLRDDQYSTIRRLIAASPYMSGYDLKGAIEYGLDTIPVAHLAPTDNAESLKPKNTTATKIDTIESLQSRFTVLQKAKDAYSQQLGNEQDDNKQQLNNNTNDNDKKNSNELNTENLLSTSLSTLAANDENSMNTQNVLQSNNNTNYNIDEWNISPFLKEALKSEQEPLISMAPQHPVLTASYQDFEYSDINDLRIGDEEITKLVDKATHFSDLEAIDVVKFQPLTFKDSKPKPTLYQVSKKYTDIISDVVMDMTPCERSAVVLTNFRPSEDDESEEKIREEISKYTERRRSTVSIAMDGTKHLSLWDQQLIPMKKPPLITLQPVDDTNEDNKISPASSGRTSPILSTNSSNENSVKSTSNPAQVQSSNKNEEKRSSNLSPTSQNDNTIKTVKVENVDAGGAAEKILEALVVALSPETGSSKPKSRAAKELTELLTKNVQGQQQSPINNANFSPSVSPTHIMLPPSTLQSPQLNASRSGLSLQHSASNSSVNESISKSVIRPDILIKARMNRIEKVQEILEDGVPVDVVDEFGNQLIHVGAQVGSKKVVRLALRFGADINAQNYQGQTALHYAYAYRYESLATYLLSKGADPNILNQFNLMPQQGLRIN